MVIVAATGGAYPALISHVFGQLSGDAGTPFYAPYLGEGVIVIPALIILLASIKACAMYFQILSINALALRITTDMQKAMFSHLVDAELSLHLSSPAGSFISRLMNDLMLVREAVVRLANNLVRDALTIIVMVGVMFWFSWSLSVLVLAVYPLAMRPIITIGRKQRHASTALQEHNASLTALLTESLQGIRMVKAYQLEGTEKKRAFAAFEALYRRLVALLAGRARIDPILEALGGVAVAGVIGLATWQVSQGQMQTSDVIGFITALVMLVQPVRAMGTLNAVSEEGAAALSRIYDLLDRKNSLSEASEPLKFVPQSGDVTFANVSFSYGDDTVLDDISFTAKAGEMVALVGPSGAGKSTILNLIPRFFDADKGQITIDGADVREMSFDSLRQAIALVSQDAVLFDDTIAANIGFGRAGSAMDEIMTAARNAAADSFIQKMDGGYDADVGATGNRLSGGQKQRIAIARAMIRNAPVLLLDEATSALDAHSEQQVQKALDRLSAGRTSIVIAHRLASIIHADQILVMDKGQIVERGRHDELLAKNGLYAELCRLQSLS